jgi:HK97 family phage major capsid protein/HK97 family phage prohead protease
MKKAYSAMQIKKIEQDDDFTYIEGVASTPTSDRVGDEMNPMGAKFQTPMPLLWQHYHDEPVGHVTFASPTKKGIPFKARLPRVKEAGKLKERIDEAIQSLKYKLVAFVSIGFKPVWDAAEKLASGGYRFNAWEWYELSLVTIPANAEAVITSVKGMDASDSLNPDIISHIKKIDTGVQASLGITEPEYKRPGVSGVSIKKTEKKAMKKTIAEQIAQYKASRSEKVKEMESLMSTANEEGRTLDAEESEHYDTLSDETEAIDKHIERLQKQEKTLAATAEPVTPQPQTPTKAYKPGVAVKDTKKLLPGVAFARAAKCLALSQIEKYNAVQIAQNLYGGYEDIVKATAVLSTKAAVGVGATTTGSWGAELVGDETAVFADFVEYLRPMTIVGKFGTNGIPGLRGIPFRVALVGQTSGGDGYWVGESKPKPLTKFDFERSTLEPLKVANIAVVTMELVRDSSPSAELLVRDSLAKALSERMDIDFIDPDKAAVSGVSPASILNGISAIGSSGTDADAVRADVRALFNAFIAANNAPTDGVWIMKATTALALSLMVNPLGQPEFPGLSMTGGTFMGLPAIVSEYVPSDSSGATVALVNASDIYFGDEGGISLDMSTEASLQMSDDPDDPADATTVLVSLWQHNMLGFRAERTVNWKRRRASAAAHLSGVAWGA